ncbi:unnamed protein product [Leuciscus chuanchicus]
MPGGESVDSQASGFSLSQGDADDVCMCGGSAQMHSRRWDKEKDQGLTGPRCPGLGLQALESWRVAPLHEVQLFFRHASGLVKISLMGRDRHLRALHPQDLWMSDSDTVPKSLT